MTTEEDTRSVILVSQESESFEVPLSIAMMSELVKQIIDPELVGEDEKQEIPLPNVKSSILAKVIEFTNHYKSEPMTEIEKVMLSDSVYYCLSNDFISHLNLRICTMLFKSGMLISFKLSRRLFLS